MPGALRERILGAARRRGFARNPSTMEGALARCAARNPGIRTVIDVGASDGRWSRAASRILPPARYLMVEARAEHEPGLARTSRDARFSYAICAAGNRDGEIYFDATDLFGGLASETPPEKNCIVVPVRRLDGLARERGLDGPYAIKLDTHGYEVPILEGAAGLLPQTALLVIECYNFRVAPQALLAHEMCAWLEARGFRCIDLCDPLHRPRDGALWQMDLFFAPATDAAFTSNVY
ncbi:MAG TPA: FkbM family methyltransferase [Burkholderiales bacterium]|jgi:FkbM family methyltransferase|nr:FkbM family methyltransferase [Burkholderiales bacterium]